MATELATAYITLIPSLKGAGSSITSQLSSIDTASVGASMGKKMGSGVSSGLSAAKIAIGNVLANVATSAISSITSSIDGAISRVDTLNQFPKVMANFGYSSEEAEACVNKLSDSIDGLPTTLDDIVAQTQLWTTTLGDMDEATDLTIALNDAMSSYSATSEQTSSVMTQLQQMMSTGTYDTQSWNSVVQNSNGLMKTLAEEMLGAGSSAADLREALNDGTISTEDFADKLITLDQEGSDSVTAFSETAKDATSGISTSMQNVGTAISKNIGNIIDTINGDGGRITGFFDDVKAAINTAGGIANDAVGKIVTAIEDLYAKAEEAGVISAFGDVVQAAGDVIQAAGDAIGSVADSVEKLAGKLADFVTGGDPAGTAMDTLKDAAEKLGDGLGAVKDGLSWVSDHSDEIVAAMTGIGTALLVMNAKALLTAGAYTAISIAMGAAEIAQRLLNIAMAANPLGIIVTLIIGVVTALITLYATNEDFRALVQEVWNTVKEKVGGVIDSLVTFFTEDIPNALTDLVTAFTSIPGKVKAELDKVIAKVTAWATKMKAKAKKVASDFVSDIKNGFAKVPSTVWSALKGAISKVAAWGTQMKNKAVSAAKQVVSGIKNTLQGLVSQVTTIGKNIAQGLWNGIAGLKDWVVSKVSAMGTSILKAVKRALKIGSPSREFYDVGRYIMLGWANGLDDYGSKVTGSVEGTLKSVMGASDSVFGGSGLAYSAALDTGSAAASGAFATSSGNTWNLQVTVDGAEDPEQWATGFIRGVRRQARMNG